MAQVQIEPIAPASTDAVDRIVALLSSYSAEQGYRDEPQEFALEATVDGRMVGGLVGSIHWGWLHIAVLAVEAEQRGRGHGRALIERAEAIARERGCVGAWVDTFTFQAAGFFTTGWLTSPSENCRPIPTGNGKSSTQNGSDQMNSLLPGGYCSMPSALSIAW